MPPHADPRAKGIADSLALDVSLDNLAVLYLAAVQAVAYRTRAIIETMNQAGLGITQILVTGGGTKNPVWMQQHADIPGLPLTRTREPEAVLLGAAILGTAACVAHSDIPAAMQAMTHIGETLLPDTGTQAYHDAKYECYCSLYQEQITRRTRMDLFA